MKIRKLEKFIQQNSPDGGFLQSEEWQKFQENVGQKTFNIAKNNFLAKIIEHKLPIVGRYFYIPRGPLFENRNTLKDIKKGMKLLFNLAKENNIGWVRIDPVNKENLEILKNNINFQIRKAPHNMQPRQIFIIDILKSEENLLAEMKSKTRYNIRLAKRKGVECNSYTLSDNKFEKNFKEFLKLVYQTANRKKVKFHNSNYYQKMIKIISEENIKLYVAKYKGKIITANLIIFFGNTATYLHGASADKYKNVMAPFLLQWQIILDAKKRGIEKYDFGGVEIESRDGDLIVLNTRWQGISRFKLGFSVVAKPFEFPGSYDIIINKKRYFVYKFLRKTREILN